MLTITRSIIAAGPIFDLLVSVSAPRENALRVKRRPIPEPIAVSALLDTGADCTLMDASVPLGLNILRPTGTTKIHCLDSSSKEVQERRTYDVDVTFQDKSETSQKYTIRVAEHGFGDLPYNAIIGRDLLEYCVFNYIGHERKIILNI